MLATFLRPSAGRIVVAGHDADRDPAAVRRATGYLPEALPGYADARVDEFLDFRARLKGIPRRERRVEIDRCLGCCELVAVRRRMLGRLSQGYRRRAGLADALLGSPPVLLLDEPTVGLDPLQVRQTRELFRELSSHTTILLSTHLLGEARAVCDRVLMLIAGRLSPLALDEPAVGATFRITLRAPAAEASLRLSPLEGVTAVKRLTEADGLVTLEVTATMDVRESVVRECVASGWGVREIRSLGDDLESRFVRAALDQHREAA